MSLNTGNAILSNAITVDSSYRVGIGTSTPDIFSRGYTGNIVGISATSGDTGLEINGGTSSGAYIDLGAAGTRRMGLISTATESQLISLSTVPLVFKTNSVERMRMTSDGTLQVPYGKYLQWTSYSDASSRSWGIRSNESNVGDFAIISSTSNNDTLSAVRLTITNAGNVGIGTITPDNLLVVSGGTGSMKLEATTTNRSAIQIFNTQNNMYLGVDNAAASYFGYVAYSANIQTLNYPIIFSNGSGAPTERMRITPTGYTKISNNGTYTNVAGPYHEMYTNYSNNEVVVFRNSSASPYGYTLQFSGASPNGGSNWFMYCEDSTAQRFSVRSNGGVYNYTGNNVPLSDQRMKKEITPLESYWNKFKEIEMVKFKYIDQTHDDFNIGVVSQQIESIMPEFVDVWDERNIPEDGKPLMGVYMEDIHNIAMKVLQEAMAKIEQLETQIQAQQQQINQLINK